MIDHTPPHWTPSRLAPRERLPVVVEEEAPLFPIEPPALRVRSAPGAPGILVAHLAAAPKPYVYVGRQMKGITASPLGNRYSGPGAIESFKAYLRTAYRAVQAGGGSLAQQQAIAELRRLVDIYRETGALTLACWCAPDSCHADEIARAIIGICEAEPVELPDLGWAIYHRETAEEGLPWVVLGEDGKVKRATASLADARRPLGWQDPAPTPTRRGEYLLPEGAAIEGCRSCGAAIVWITTVNNRPLPLSVATAQRRDGQAWALSHFVDCAHGRDWKKK